MSMQSRSPASVAGKTTDLDMPWPPIILGTLLLGGLIFSAQADFSHQQARELVAGGEILPLQQILDRLEEEQPGRILEVELEQKHGGYIYEIELLDAQGRVWELEFNAENGELIEREQED